VSEIAPKRSLPLRALRLLIFCACTFLLFQFCTLYLSWHKQVVLGVCSVAIAIVLNRISRSLVVTISLMLLAMAATLRYSWWRLHTVFNYFTDESNNRISIDSLLMLVLLSAEAYTTGVMVLGFMQTAFPLHRKPVPLPPDDADWPHVDLLIPTYNEALSLVRYTALAAINIDYPPEKLHVYILDDGTREDFRQFAEEAGIGYIVREKHNHAKAGNINHALTKMNSPFVTIFDCDHVPTRSFLQFTLGWFLVEEKLAMLQTPHHFYSPDPFERNLLQYTTIPNEGELFYGIIQDGSDFWNATFFCGSCAVMRRTALDEVGGIAVETVTEDAHTSLRMQKHGWNTAYINFAQAAGLATETLAAHVGQRVRWARGMIQILRTDNPLLGKGLKLSQKLCYFNSMVHFMYAVPRLIFVFSPLAYMLFGRTIIPGYWVAILAYALPHLCISSLTNSRVQGRHRHSFWNEIYETVLAPYILLPTLLALINPKLGKFNVTDKGTTLEATQFDRKIAAPTTWMLGINFLGVLMAPYRFFVLDPTHPGTVISNLFWVLFNMMILGVAAAVAHEQMQRRSSVRIPTRIPVLVTFEDGRQAAGMTRDMSVGGASIIFAEDSVPYRRGQKISVQFPMQTGNDEVRSTIVAVINGEARLRFQLDSIEEQEVLTRALYSRANCWIANRGHIEEDRPLVSLARIFRLSLTGFRQVALGLIPRKRVRSVAARVASTTALLLLVSLVCGTKSFAQTTPEIAQLASFAPAVAAPVSGSKARITFKDMGVEEKADLEAGHSYYSLRFVLPHTALPRTATLNLSYHFDRLLAPRDSSIQVRLNETLIGTLAPPQDLQQGNEFAYTSFVVPPELLIRENEITFEFNGGTASHVRRLNPADGSDLGAIVAASIGGASYLDIASDPIPFRTDLSLLPLPIFDAALQTTTTIRFVFLAQPGEKTLEAAGAVASWFGVLSSTKPVRFSVSIASSAAQIPAGNVVLFADDTSLLPQSLDLPTDKASLSIKANPNDPTSAALVLAAPNEDQLLAVARTLALLKPAGDLRPGQTATEQGDTRKIDGFKLPAVRKPNDAPRWLSTDRLVPISTDEFGAKMETDGSRPVPLYFRVPPDLYPGEVQALRMHLNYRFNALPLLPGSALRVYYNDMLVNEIPLGPGSGSNERQREVGLPFGYMRSANTLLFSFDFNARRLPGDQKSPETQLEGQILKNTSLDIRGLPHWAPMPNLELFANAGFPFTRIADLGETVVVLPARPSPQEIALFLHLMAHCGAQTGYPVLRAQVAGPDDSIRANRDYLVLGAVKNQPFFANLNRILPTPFDADRLYPRARTDLLSQLEQRWHQLLREPEEDAEVSGQTELPLGVIEGMESPFASGRSLVLVALQDDSAEEAFSDAFFERAQSSDIKGSVSLLRGDRFVSGKVPTASYHIGLISRYAQMRLLLTEHFALLLLAVSLASLILAVWVREYLVRRAQIRLRHAPVHV